MGFKEEARRRKLTVSMRFFFPGRAEIHRPSVVPVVVGWGLGWPLGILSPARRPSRHRCRRCPTTRGWRRCQRRRRRPVPAPRGLRRRPRIRVSTDIRTRSTCQGAEIQQLIHRGIIMGPKKGISSHAAQYWSILDAPSSLFLQGKTLKYMVLMVLLMQILILISRLPARLSSIQEHLVLPPAQDAIHFLHPPDIPACSVYARDHQLKSRMT